MILLAFIVLVMYTVWMTYRQFAYRQRTFAGKTVLVVGACSIAGRRLCQRLHAQGAKLVAWDGSKTRLEELRREVTTQNILDSVSEESSSARQLPQDRFVTLPVDISSRLQLQRAATELLAQQRIDVVLCVGLPRPEKQVFEERGDDAVERLLEATTLAPLLLAKILCPVMAGQREGGHFVTFVATENSIATEDHPDYAATQRGLVGMHYCLRAWVHRRSVRGAAGRDSQSALREAVSTTPKRGGSESVRLTLVYLDAEHYAPGTNTRSTRMTTPAGTSSTATENAFTSEGANADTVDRALTAIARGEERFREGWAVGTWVVPLALGLPVPWGAAVLRLLESTPLKRQAKDKTS